MPSIKDLTKLVVLIFFSFQLVMESIAYPIAENTNQDSKSIEPRQSMPPGADGVNEYGEPIKKKKGYAKPVAGGIAIGALAALAYGHLTKGSHGAAPIPAAAPVPY